MDKVKKKKFSQKLQKFTKHYNNLGRRKDLLKLTTLWGLTKQTVLMEIKSFWIIYQIMGLNFFLL